MVTVGLQEREGQVRLLEPVPEERERVQEGVQAFLEVWRFVPKRA